MGELGLKSGISAVEILSVDGHWHHGRLAKRLLTHLVDLLVLRLVCVILDSGV